MKQEDEFYICYQPGMPKNTKKTVARFVVLCGIFLGIGAFVFGFFQETAVNSNFDFGNPSQVMGIYHESPYPMLQISLGEQTFKNVVLLGFGKSGPNPYLKSLREEYGKLHGRKMRIEGQLIYYNGQTLLEIDDSQKIEILEEGKAPLVQDISTQVIEGEIVDSKCYFGVMKPGFGKIHRSCAALCIAGGVPPVLVSTDKNGHENYFLLTDLKGNALHKDILPYIGQPVSIKGNHASLGGWNILRIQVAEIEKLDKPSSIY